MILVTGGYGCIGAELVKWLLRNSTEEVLLGSRTVSDARTQRVYHDVDCSRLTCSEIDVCDRERLDAIFKQHEITRVAHLAALQTPDCNAHRDLGLQINLGGTQHLIEAMKVCGRTIDRFVYASSIAVYGSRDSYKTTRVPMLAEPQPVNVYGVWKLASEQVSQFFGDATGTSTICLRPGVLFGPGRDAGLTSTPTTGMKCVALGLPYEIPYCSPQDYLYAPDVGAAFANALIEPFDGYGVFTLPARTVSMSEFVDAMREAADEFGLGDQFHVTFGDDEVPFICELEFEPFLQHFPKTPHTPLKDALVGSLSTFSEFAKKGWLTQDDIAAR